MINSNKMLILNIFSNSDPKQPQDNVKFWAGDSISDNLIDEYNYPHSPCC